VTKLLAYFLGFDALLYWLHTGRHVDMSLQACAYMSLTHRINQWTQERDELGDKLIDGRSPFFMGKESVK